MEFKFMDLVQLKAGGAVMFVGEVSGDSVQCLDMRTKQPVGTFAVSELKRYQQSGPAGFTF